ncbi:MAG: glycoside hydrolase family 5 protein [Emergencia sp.]|nr:glycoside hydrolase family 5 protein [Emergencia sp.]
MKRRGIVRVLAVILLFGIIFSGVCFADNDNEAAELLQMAQRTKTPFEKYGALKVEGSKLLAKDGSSCQLHGVSTHGIAWFPEYVNKSAFKNLRDQWGVDTIRLAMYTTEYNGYCNSGTENRTKQRKRVYTGIDAATDLGMYVIVDWHILSDGNPNRYVSRAKDFFGKVSKRYKDQENIIYEICNEPNGGVTWSQIKKYAKQIIPVIRKNNPDAIIIVGTPHWSQDVDKAAASPLKYDNLLYSLHFYAGTHKQDLRDKMEKAVKKGLPIFVSEFSICDASGTGALNKTQGKKWITSLNRHDISYVAWNLSNKNESSALIKTSCKKTKGWTRADFSASGKWYMDQI